MITVVTIIIVLTICVIVILKLGTGKKVNPSPLKKKSNFTIEYYPITNRYFPKYEGKYMYRQPSTGIFQIQNYMVYSQNFKTQEEARVCIIVFKEQFLKENVKIIEVD